jgi:enamine deaminase RidA (YjgF/YER057c/UK114 family)
LLDETKRDCGVVHHFLMSEGKKGAIHSTSVIMSARGARSTKPRRKVLGSHFPTSKMAQVVALAHPKLLLEINAIAVIS